MLAVFLFFMTGILTFFQLKVYFSVNLLQQVSVFMGREDLFRDNERLAAYTLLAYMCFCLFYALSTIKYTRALGFTTLPRTNLLTFLSTAMIFQDTCLPLYYNYLHVVLKAQGGDTQTVW